MKAPETPNDEAHRLQVLQSLDILDTPAEERFDRLTRLARRVLKMPIALVSLIDEDRQWFKSRAGLDAHETPRDISFCGHAILGDAVLIVNDATKDERFADNPLVLGAPHIRFYAGYPLQHTDGSKLGTLCIIDHVPRTLSDDDLDTLRDLAELAQAELIATHLATLDELTQVLNRRGFITLAQKSLNLCIRQKLQATLVFFDLDGFKAVNDQFGHAEGDTALNAFATLMSETFRDSDVIARLGGDEFVVLLTDASTELTADIIERFRQSLATYNETANRGYKILFSAGSLAIKPADEYSIDVLLSKADSLMYENKRKKSGVHTGQQA